MSGYIGVNLRDILFDETLGEIAAKAFSPLFKAASTTVKNRRKLKRGQLWQYIKILMEIR